MSAPLTPAAWTRTSSSEAPGSGSGWSSMRISPSRTVAARIAVIVVGGGARSHGLSRATLPAPPASGRERPGRRARYMSGTRRRGSVPRTASGGPAPRHSGSGDTGAEELDRDLVLRPAAERHGHLSPDDSSQLSGAPGV